jgi:hypothetical protein
MSPRYSKIVSKINDSSQKNNGDFRPTNLKLPKKVQQVSGNPSYLEQIEIMGNDDQQQMVWSPIDHKSERYKSMISKLNEIIIGSPSYLEEMDKKRGYPRKINWKRQDSNTTVVAARAKGLFDLIVSEDMKEDVRRRGKVYKSDWTDGFKKEEEGHSSYCIYLLACSAERNHCIPN